MISQTIILLIQNEEKDFFSMLIDRLKDQHIENFFQNLIKSTRNQIVFTIFRLIWIQTDVCLDPNQSKNGEYNLISG